MSVYCAVRRHGCCVYSIQVGGGGRRVTKTSYVVSGGGSKRNFQSYRVGASHGRAVRVRPSPPQLEPFQKRTRQCFSARTMRDVLRETRMDLTYKTGRHHFTPRVRGGVSARIVGVFRKISAVSSENMHGGGVGPGERARSYRQIM